MNGHARLPITGHVIQGQPRKSVVSFENMSGKKDERTAEIIET